MSCLAMIPLSGFVVLAASALRVFTRAGYGYLAVGSWSLFILWCHALDVLNAPAWSFPYLTAALAVVALWCGLAFVPDAARRYRAANDPADALELWLAWACGFVVVLLPRLAAMRPGTVVWGHFIVNDGVAHSLYALGEAYLREDGISTTFLSTYPRGFHSFLRFVASGVLRRDPPAVILPITLFCHSLCTVFAWHVLDTAGVRSRIARVVLAAAAGAAFLNVVSAYLLFSSQAAVVPLILAWAFRQLHPVGKEGSPVVQAALLLAAVTIYGVFPLSLVFLAVLLSLDHARRWPGQLRAAMGALSPRRIAAGTAVLLAGLPAALSLALFGVGMWAGTDRAASVWVSRGNLAGYLSPLHMSGFWTDAVDYRGRLDPSRYSLEYVQILFLLVECALVLLVPFGRRSFRFLACFAVPWFGLPLLSVTEYLHFKYFALLLAAFQAVAFACFALWALRKPRLLGWGHVVTCTFAVALVVLAVRSLPNWPTVSQREFRRFERMRGAFLGQGRTLVLTVDDWLRFYRSGHDDWFPLIMYYPVAYDGGTPDFVMVDRRYPTATQDFLQRFPNVGAMIAPPSRWCTAFTDERFTVYARRCPDVR